ncbi:MAG: hypothetical protein LBB88_02315 [Planctomycetaceae bacterium]|nr:hypothetical protein [Planctomycetaceae bacterium]
MSPSVAEQYYQEARTIGKAEGEAIGEARGEVRGKAEGEAIGEARGEVRGKAQSIIRILRNRLEEPPTRLQNRIMNVKSIAKLDELFEFAFNCVSLGEFETALN